jgi:3',5'-cyclic AMP phosphodiesterase CpdA
MFVLAHISDPHLGPLPRPRIADLAGKRALGYINWRRKRRVRHRPEILDRLIADLKSTRPDHIALTGDLVNLALRAEFPAAREWLSRIGSPTDVTVVPGNHDAYMRDAVAYPIDHWGDYMRADGPGLAAPADRPPNYPFVRCRGRIALVGLSTAVPTAPFLATGRLGGEQLMRLADILTHLGHQGLFRVVLLHHPPITEARHRLKGLIDAGGLLRVLGEHGAELVLHGHIHVHSLCWLEGPVGPIPAVGVPSASASVEMSEEPAAYNLYCIEPHSGGWRCEAIRRGFMRPHEQQRRSGAGPIVAGPVELGRERLL